MGTTSQLLKSTQVSTHLRTVGVRADRERIGQVADVFFPDTRPSDRHQRRFDEHQVRLLTLAFFLHGRAGVPLDELHDLVDDPELASAVVDRLRRAIDMIPDFCEAAVAERNHRKESPQLERTA